MKMQKLISMVTRALWCLAPSWQSVPSAALSTHSSIITEINRKGSCLSGLLCLRIFAFPFPPSRISPFSPHALILPIFRKAISAFFLIPQAFLGPHHLAGSTGMLFVSQLMETGDVGSYSTASPFVALCLAPTRCSGHNFLISKWSLDNYTEDRGFAMAPYSFWNSR